MSIGPAALLIGAALAGAAHAAGGEELGIDMQVPPPGVASAISDATRREFSDFLKHHLPRP